MIDRLDFQMQVEMTNEALERLRIGASEQELEAELSAKLYRRDVQKILPKALTLYKEEVLSLVKAQMLHQAATPALEISIPNMHPEMVAACVRDIKAQAIADVKRQLSKQKKDGARVYDVRKVNSEFLSVQEVKEIEEELRIKGQNVAAVTEQYAKQSKNLVFAGIGLAVIGFLMVGFSKIGIGVIVSGLILAGKSYFNSSDKM